MEQERSNYKRILVTNIAQIGDVIVSTSVLNVLKKSFPEAEIGFLGALCSREVLLDHVHVDYLHFFDHPHYNRSQISLKEKKKRGSTTFLKALKEIQEKQYDVAFELWSLRKANGGQLLKMANIPERFGFWGGGAHNCFTHKCYVDPEKYHVVEIFGKLLVEFGLEEHLSHLKPILSYKNEITKLPLPEKYILIHVGAGDVWKEWSYEAWKKLIEKLHIFSLPLVFLGHGPKEGDLVDRITSGSQGEVYNLSNQCSWKQLIPIIKNANLLIALDSMAGHMAAALDTKAVIIYGGTAPQIRWRPFNDGCHVIMPPAEYCVDGTPLKGSIRHINPESVFDKVKEVLA
jgi:ADP-heptose:LPS heptosyltransferase